MLVIGVVNNVEARVPLPFRDVPETAKCGAPGDFSPVFIAYPSHYVEADALRQRLKCLSKLFGFVFNHTSTAEIKWYWRPRFEYSASCEIIRWFPRIGLFHGESAVSCRKYCVVAFHDLSLGSANVYNMNLPDNRFPAFNEVRCPEAWGKRMSKYDISNAQFRSMGRYELISSSFSGLFDRYNSSFQITGLAESCNEQTNGSQDQGDEIVDQLSMFGLIEARNGLYGFRDLAAARQVAGLLAAGTALSVITKSLHEFANGFPRRACRI